MGLGSKVATTLCEHAVLTRTVQLAWPNDTPKQTWGNRHINAEPHDLLDVKKRSDLARTKTVIFDLTQLVYGFPKAGREWIRSHCDTQFVSFEGNTLEEVLTKCIDGGYHIGTVEQLPDKLYAVHVDTFNDEMLTGFLFDRLLSLRRGLTALLPDLVAAYYLVDGDRPAAKSITSKKRSLAKSRSEEHKLRQRVEEFLGPDRVGLLEPTPIQIGGQEMLQGSLFDYLRSRDNLWRLIDCLSETVERVGGQSEADVDVFVARGWNSSTDSSNRWFRIAGNRPESARPLRDYFSGNVDLEADAMMIRLGRFATNRLNGPSLLSTTDSDVLVSMIAIGSPELFWAKQLGFRDKKNVVVRTVPADSKTRSLFVPHRIDLRSIDPLEEPEICNDNLLPKVEKSFLFSSCPLGDTSKWSNAEAERRLCAIFIVLLNGCDFCEDLSSFGPRGMVRLLSQKPKLRKVHFSRITSIQNINKELEHGMRRECLTRSDEAVRFPWRCGDFVCLVEVDFETMKMLIRAALTPKPIEGRDWRPFIRRLCYSAMTLAATGIGLEKEIKVNAQLAENFGYDSTRDFEYIQFEDEEYRSVQKNK